MDQVVEITTQQSAPYTEFFSWGSDQYGQLALANSEDENTQYYKQTQFYDQPKSLSFDILISAISCGDYHAVFISGDGFVFSVGRNTDGQLGVGDQTLTHSSAPLLIDSLPKGSNNPIQISCGGSHSAVLLQNGELYLWGSGQYGAIGTSQLQNAFSPQKVNSKERTDRFSTVSCGKRHTLCIDQYGTVYGCGDNQNRQLGLNFSDRVLEVTKISDFQQQAKSVAAGIDHSLILTDDDKVYACGNNNEGNLGLGHNYSSDKFLLVHGMQGFRIKCIEAGRHSAAITQDGRLFVWGPVFKGDKPLLLPQELRSNKLMLTISIGEVFSAVIDEDNHLYTWGVQNTQGQLGRRIDFSEEMSMKMPQIIESLAHKIVREAKVGLDFGVALGMDFDIEGNPLEINKNNGKSQINQTLSYTNHLDKSPSSHSHQQNNYQHSPYSNVSKYSNTNNMGSTLNQIPPSYKETTYLPDQIQINSFPQKPPIVNNYQSSTYQQQQITNSIKKETPNQNNISSITANSNKSREIQNSQYLQQNVFTQNQRIPTKQDSLTSFQSQVQVKNERLQSPLQQQQQPTYTSPIAGDLYKQIEQLREENFTLKQKNREINQQLNQMKDENDLLLKNAEEEVKRMSKFIDTYTSEIDASKKLMEYEFDQQLGQEKKKYDDLKQKFHQDQNLLENKLDNLQKEIENLRQENLQMRQEKHNFANKDKLFQEQMQSSQQKVNIREISQSFQRDGNRQRNTSPMLGQKNQEEPTLSYSTGDGYKSKTPLNVSSNSQYQDIYSRQNQNLRQFSYKDQVQEKDKPFVYESNMPKAQNQRENLFQGQIVNQKTQNQLPKFNTNQDSQEIFYPPQIYHQNPNVVQKPPLYQDQYYAINEGESEQMYKAKDSPKRKSNDRFGISSPLTKEQPIQSKQDFIKGGFQIEPENSRQNLDDYKRQQYNEMNFRDQQPPPSQFIYQQLPKSQIKNEQVLTSSQNLMRDRQQPQYNPSTSPLRTINEESYKGMYKMQIKTPDSHDLMQSPQSHLYIDAYKKEEKENAFSHSKYTNKQEQNENVLNYSQGQSSLSDVKSRLVAMQRNKEELEEKLKSYEAKIKQHFNR